jgi:hypothetical protein
MTNELTNYLNLITSYFVASTQANIAALKDFEAAHPDIRNRYVDEVYQAVCNGASRYKVTP